MARLIEPFEQFFDSNGDPLAFGLLDFYESGGSTVRKATYADSAETIANSNPLVLKGDGRASNTFGSGRYRVILRDSTGAQILQREIGGVDSLTFGAEWVSTQTYSIGDVVREDNQYWESQSSGNIGNTPSTDGGSNWLLFLALTFANEADLALKANLSGAPFTGAISSTAGDVNLKTSTALADADATLTAAQLIGGEFTITPTVARTLTTDTAANIISALTGSVDNSNFEFTVVNLAGFNVIIAAGASVTLVGSMVIRSGAATFRARRLTSSTVSVTRLDSEVSASPISGTATFTNSTNNIALTGIGLITGLEVGDVISVSGTASNDTEYTVEVITDDDNVIVNQAHAGGTTTKSLTDETVACTVTLLSRWYNAPIGLGQGAVNVTASRADGVTYTNLINRPLFVSISITSAAGGSSGSLKVDGNTVLQCVHAVANVGAEWQYPVPVGSTYLKDGTAFQIWSELR